MELLSTHKVLTVPGWHGSGPEHWQSIWEKRNPSFSRVQQSDWKMPQKHEWITALDDRIRESAEPIILVAHSLGCLAVAHWAQRLYPAHKIAAALLVAPPWFGQEETCPPETRSFLPIPTGRLPFATWLVASRNDPYLSFSAATQLSGLWGSQLVDAGWTGHINAESGYGEWPEGEDLLRRILTASAPQEFQQQGCGSLLSRIARNVNP